MDYATMNCAALRDEELVAQVRVGESWAMSVLYDRYARLVFSLALAILQDRGVAEEAVQEVFFKVWSRAGDYGVERGKFSSWLARIAHNHAIDLLRQRRTRPQATADEEEMWQIVDRGPTPLDMAEQSLEHREIVQALKAIPNEQRCAIELAYFEGLSHQEIANQLHTPLGTVKTRIRRGMQNLKTALAQAQ
jgi:RNA polymerase sigma-70 factor, ECF subfamily